MMHPDNGVWLPDYNKIPDVPAVLATMEGYGVRDLFVYNGGLAPDGSMGPHWAADWMKALHAYEALSGYRFNILVALPGKLGTGEKDVDFTKPDVQAGIAQTCARYTQPGAQGSYVAGLPRAFDGVAFDVEPGGVYGTSAPFVAVSKAVRAAIGPGKLIGFYTPAHTARASDWGWTSQEYSDMARDGVADLLMIGDYDAWKKTPDAYQAYIRQQTIDILTAVASGGGFQTAGTTAPSPHCKIMLGFAAYGEKLATKNHDPAVENIITASDGASEGLSFVTPAAAQYLQGAHVFLQTDGAGLDGNATYAKDWPDFNKHWLGALPDIPTPVLRQAAVSGKRSRDGFVTLTAHGSGFVALSVIQWNGVALPTTFVDDKTLRATVGPDDADRLTGAQVTVFSPTRGIGGGGTSSAVAAGPIK